MTIKKPFASGKLAAELMLAASVLVALPVVAAQSAAPYTTATRYNLMGQVTGVIHPAPASGQGFPASRNTYNSRGLLERVEEGVLSYWYDETVPPASWSGLVLARQQLFTYDALGRKVTAVTLTAAGSAESLTQFSYDDLNQLTCKAERMNPAMYASLPADACTLGTEGSFGPDRISRYEYVDAFGQMTKEFRAVGTALQQTYVTRQYDSSGRLSDETDANGNLSHLTYDSANRIEFLYFPNKTTGAGSYNAADYEKYAYDNNGNRTSLRKRDGRIIAYSYDALNRPWFKDIPASTTADVYLAYDLLGLQKYARFGSASGAGISTAFNGFGELVSETSNMSGTNYTLSYAYDQNANRKRITHPDNSYFTYRYDGLDRLTDIYEGVEGGTLLVHSSYDSLARLESMSTAGAVVNSIAYDGLSRPGSITLNPSGTVNDVSHSLAYNPAGQIVNLGISNNTYQYREKGSKAGTYSVNGLNEYTAVAGKTYGYDSNANLTSDGDTTFAYDVENRLTGATGLRNASLSYDPLGHLYQVASGGQSTYFLYSGDSLVGEYQNGALTRRYVFGVGVDKPLLSYSGAAVSGANRQFLHGNYQGSVIAASDNAGAIAYVNTYDVYGVPGTANQGRFAYTGQTYLPELGMYYYKARMYYPGIGRFMQTDPIGYKDDMNLYGYVGEDPVNKTDSTGLCPMCVGFVIGAAVDAAIQVGVNMASGDNFGSAVSHIDAKSVVLAGALGAAGQFGGARALTETVRGFSNATKGKIGEAVARVGIAARGETVIARGEQAKKVAELGNITGRAGNAKPDFVVRTLSGDIKAVEAKFGTSKLTGAQSALKKQMGDAFTVSRTTYQEVGAAGGAAGAAAAGAAGNCVAGSSGPCKR